MPEPVTLFAFGGGILGLLAHLARRYFEIAKEVFDIVLGAIAFVLSLPVVGICAVFIKIFSKGPLIYVQVRVGKNGKLFRMYKLRTMHIDAESVSGATWAKYNDPRIIPYCRWIRSSHLDELPQLINVMKGDMSLIGPRPERPEILEQLEKIYPDIRKRLSVRPGITGLAQVRNGYDTTIEGVRNKLKADLEYIECRKWGMELRILAATISKFHDRTAH